MENLDSKTYMLTYPYMLFGGRYTHGYRINNVLGGWDDFRGRFKTYQEAIQNAEATKLDWWHLVDGVTMLVIARVNNGPKTKSE